VEPEVCFVLSVKQRVSDGALMNSYSSAFLPFFACSPVPLCGYRHDLGYEGRWSPAV
jgi:hypothetical protein